MDYKSLEDIIVKLPLYGTFSLKAYDESGKNNVLIEDTRNIFKELFFKKKVNLKCIQCGKEYPFEVSHLIKKQLYKDKLYYHEDYISSFFTTIDNDTVINNTISIPENDEGIIEYTFECQMDNNHYYKMYLYYQLSQGFFNFRKVGQIPLNTDLQETYSNDYKTILKRYGAFDDYRCFEQSASRGLLAGACTYLRRILEKIVLKMLTDKGLMNDEKVKKARFDEKIKLVKNGFDYDVQEVIDSSYSLLSKGVHELNNDEIETFYSAILEVINVQLQSEKERIQKETKRKEIKNKIDEAVSHHDQKK